MLIYVCVSTHGYGHAARQAAVLIQLHRLQPDWHLVISSCVDETFLDLVLRDVPVSRRVGRWDVGMLQADALGVDQQATLQGLQQLEIDLPRLLQREVDWILGQDSQCVVLADIPPAAAELARQLDAPLIWMGNFGWDEIYAPFGGAFLDWANNAKRAYRSGTLLLRCPFSLPMNWLLPEQTLDLVSADPEPLPRDLERRLRADGRKIVLVGFGGLGYSLQKDLFSRWPQHLFLMPSPKDCVELEPITNVLFLPQTIRFLDVMPFCDRLLGKPGFSSFCEAMTCGLALHVVERHGFAEASALMDGLRRHAAHRILTRQSLELGDWKLDQPLEPAAGAPLRVGGAVQAAEAIRSVASNTVKQG
ncbi:hypothetical protein SynBIOSU31_01522 [Synechococcus sp. BIOS-U3-1]|uniref:hypothetical protein n=1 Tax=Synechococcus sp. BIOS-U3-1 TaxID=1400865 RepID=UPI001645EB45|nr:hypothetical protein [Synechococcus sp. BIOS-U3-1]QNI58395.1 hypothetical protein SynBIOSU31_01522 [Synechococcus sp. BIOS-U3-1]|tara:strand:+ start:482 stop:1567 length:1086 start_codon:yes stop_codon:yes gene_type:complete